MNQPKPDIQVEVLLDLTVMSCERTPPVVLEHLIDAKEDILPEAQDLSAFEALESGMLPRFIAKGAIPVPGTEDDPDNTGITWNPVHVQVQWVASDTLEGTYQKITEQRDRMYPSDTTSQ